MYLPATISEFLSGAKLERVHEGMSAAEVYRCPVLQSGGEEEIFYLKAEPWSVSAENEHRLYGWLYEEKRLPVPEPLFRIQENVPVDGEERTTSAPAKGAAAHSLPGDGKARMESGAEKRYGYLLLRAAGGEILQKPKYYADPERLARLAAEGIRLLRQVDIANCPVRADLGEKLKIAEEELRRGGFERLDPSVPYTKDFANHAEVFDFLVKNQPEPEPVFTHGDYCLNNFFTDGEHVTAFIDFGNGGVGDGYQDIALCVREFIEKCPKAIPIFYDQLGIREPNEEKLRYYMLLDELF